MCTGCGLCVAQYPVSAIQLGSDGLAVIDESECIRCGRCHDACPRQAVRHDRERIRGEVATNLQWVRKLLRHFDAPDEQAAFMDRMQRFFRKERTVSEQTLAVLESVAGSPGTELDAAIADLDEPAIKSSAHQRPRS